MNRSNVSNPNSATTCHPGSLDQLTAVSFSASYGVVLLLAVIGNSLVINYARTNKRIKSNVFNLFLICMATADLLDVLTVAPLHWIFFFFGNKWIAGVFGELSCKLIYFLVDVSIVTSVLALVAITLDRYFAVCYINYTPLSRLKTRFIITGIWTASCALSSIQLYKFQILNSEDGQAHCVPVWNNHDPEKQRLIVKYEMSIKFAVSYGIPLLLMIVLYGLIIRKLRKRLDSCVVEQNADLQQQIEQQNRPLVKMFITLVTIFAICWFPVHVNHMLIAFDYQTYLCLPTAVSLFFYLLAHTNAAINPLLYFIFISGFRKELKTKTKIFCEWLMGRDDSSDSSVSRLKMLRPRIASLRKQKETHEEHSDNHRNNATADQSPKPPVNPDPFAKSSNEMSSTNCGLFIEAEMNFIGMNVPIPDSLNEEKNLAIERMDRALQRSSRSSICSSRSLNVDVSYVNRAFDTDNNNRNSKSMSLPWKLSTFV